MRAVIQRVSRARLSVDGAVISEIGAGLVVYLGVLAGDGEDEADYIVKKVSAMRIFKDEAGKMNLSVSDVAGEILLVSQFTLLADCSHGNRPSFSLAERPDAADALYEYAARRLSEAGIAVKTGVFGADMKIEQFNDGPVTIVLDSVVK